MSPRNNAMIAAALAASSAMAQVPIVRGADGGSPIAVQPVQIGPSHGGAPVPQAPAPVEPAQPSAPRTAPAPVPLGNCNAGGCWDSQGNRYNATGDGARVMSPEGKLCRVDGTFINCN